MYHVPVSIITLEAKPPKVVDDKWCVPCYSDRGSEAAMNSHGSPQRLCIAAGSHHHAGWSATGTNRNRNWDRLTPSILVQSVGMQLCGPGLPDSLISPVVGRVKMVTDQMTWQQRSKHLIQTFRPGLSSLCRIDRLSRQLSIWWKVFTLSAADEWPLQIF